MPIKNPFNKHHEGDDQSGLPKGVKKAINNDAAARAQADKNAKKDPKNK